MEIKNSFVNLNGERFDNIRNIALTVEDFHDIGNFISKTGEEIGDEGIYLFQSHYDNKKALRIYKKVVDKEFNGYDDDKMISFMQEKQSNVKLTEFPTGVITLDGRIIGQEIPYYENYITLAELIKSDEFKYVLPSQLYLKMLLIIKELIKNDIYYIDIHPNNFLVRDNDIKLIDFDPVYVRYNNTKKQVESSMVGNFMFMLDFINNNSGNNTDLYDFNDVDDFSDLESELKKINKVMKK